MTCPECKAEFRAGILRCPDCDVALVERLAEPTARDGVEDLVTVLRTTDPALLPVVKTVLEAAGVPFVVQGEAALSYFPLGPAAARATGRVTGASVLVPRERAAEARELLESSPDTPDPE